MEKFLLIGYGRLFILGIISLFTIYLFGAKNKYCQLLLFLTLFTIPFIRPIYNFEDAIKYKKLLMGLDTQSLFKGGLLYFSLYLIPTFKLKLISVNLFFSYSAWQLFKKITKNENFDKRSIKYFAIYFLGTIYTLFPTILFSHPRQAFSTALYLLSFKYDNLNRKFRLFSNFTILSLSLKIFSIIMHPINGLSFIIEYFFGNLPVIKRFNFKQISFKKIQNIFISIFILVLIILSLSEKISVYIQSLYIFIVNLIPGFSSYSNWSAGENYTADPFIKLFLIIILILFPLSLKEKSANKEKFKNNNNYNIILYSSIILIAIEIIQSYLNLYSFDRMGSGLYPILIFSLYREIQSIKYIRFNLISYLGLFALSVLSLIRLFNLSNAYFYYLN